ncbi:MAG: dephospho-CoA kinase [Chitinispirillaceae bacterium]|nr:dephospho-CoA kinase [Chitinispirillaceae bacterium]
MSKTVIAVAGYMGSGKTTCTKLLASLGCREINADNEAKRLMGSSDEIKNRLVQEFGSEVVINGEIRYSLLGQIVFKTTKTVEALNTIVHPPLIEHLRKLIDESSDNVMLLDAALVPLWNIEDWFKHRLWIYADFEVRLHRLNIFRSDASLNMHELAHRMRIQETLFSPPSKNNWHHMLNENTEHAFFEQVMDWIHSVPELAQRLLS